MPICHATDLPAIPDKPDAEVFKDAPAPWRDYLIKTRAAERIADPLQRCLAFPDLPGNQWPTGHAAAHCRHHYAIKRPTLAEIGELVNRGEIAQLEKIFDESLQRHFSEDDFGDDIHDTFNYLLTRGDEGIDQLTADWLKQAPDSAYANLARGAYFNGAAWKARGGKFSSETPQDNLRRMSELVEQAIPYFERAISLNPKLMPAYTGMIDMGMMDSRPELEAKGVRGAEKFDAACPELANIRMRAISPRWGGSYEEMLAYANRLSLHLDRRPQLAINVSAPYADRGDRMVADDQFTHETVEILEIALRAGSDEDALRDAANVVMNVTDGDKDKWKGVAYLLQESRFRPTNAWGARQIGWRLVRGEPEWSLRYSQLAVSLEDKNAFGHYLLAAGYYNSKQFELAEQHYLIALEDSGQRRASLKELSSMWLFDAGMPRKAAAAKARPYVDRWIKEYPKDGAAWIMRVSVESAIDGFVEEQLILNVLKFADRKDPWQADIVRKIEQARKQVPGK